MGDRFGGKAVRSTQLLHNKIALFIDALLRYDYKHHLHRWVIDSEKKGITKCVTVCLTSMVRKVSFVSVSH